MEGTDVLKALAMGAKAVFVGRPVLWGLVHNVSDHVVIMISLIRHGFQLSHAANPAHFTSQPRRVIPIFRGFTLKI